jgi:hypothetical protein
MMAIAFSHVNKLPKVDQSSPVLDSILLLVLTFKSNRTRSFSNYYLPFFLLIKMGSKLAGTFGDKITV